MTTTSGSTGGFRSDDSFASPHNTTRRKIRRTRPDTVRERVEALINYAFTDKDFRREVRGVREVATIRRALERVAENRGARFSPPMLRLASMCVAGHRLWEANTPEDEEDDLSDVADGGDDMIAALRGIVKDKAMRKVKGTVVDLQTANVILTVYDALSEPNKKKLASLSVAKAAEVCWKLVK